MPTCRTCGTHVTVQFARVFGDNEDTVHTCMGCGTTSMLGSRPNATARSHDDGWTNPV